MHCSESVDDNHNIECFLIRPAEAFAIAQASSHKENDELHSIVYRELINIQRSITAQLGMGKADDNYAEERTAEMDVHFPSSLGETDENMGVPLLRASLKMMRGPDSDILPWCQAKRFAYRIGSRPKKGDGASRGSEEEGKVTQILANSSQICAMSLHSRIQHKDELHDDFCSSAAIKDGF